MTLATRWGNRWLSRLGALTLLFLGLAVVGLLAGLVCRCFDPRWLGWFVVPGTLALVAFLLLLAVLEWGDA